MTQIMIVCISIVFIIALLVVGSTKLCLFGLSSIRDERLHRMFRAGKVNILFPELSQQEKDAADWFHLMVLHQNHAKHGPTSHIPESFLHPNLDLVSSKC